MLPAFTAALRLAPLLALTLPLPSASAGEPVFPASWQGIWMVTTEIRDCDTGELVDTDVQPDTICAGERFGFDLEGVDVTCTGVVTDDSVAATCSGGATPFPNCEASFTAEVTGTRSGDTYTLDQRVLVVLAPLCPFADQCFDVVVTAHRTSPGEGACPPVAPVETVSWGAIKVRYRPGSPPR